MVRLCSPAHMVDVLSKSFCPTTSSLPQGWLTQLGQSKVVPRSLCSQWLTPYWCSSSVTCSQSHGKHRPAHRWAAFSMLTWLASHCCSFSASGLILQQTQVSKFGDDLSANTWMIRHFSCTLTILYLQSSLWPQLNLSAI